MADYKIITPHAVMQFAQRSGIHYDKAHNVLMEHLKDSVVMLDKEAKSDYPILKHLPGDTYLEFFCPSIREKMIAIRRKDGAIVTVLTRKIFSVHPVEKHRKLNHRGLFGDSKNFPGKA